MLPCSATVCVPINPPIPTQTPNKPFSLAVSMCCEVVWGDRTPQPLPSRLLPRQHTQGRPLLASHFSHLP